MKARVIDHTSHYILRLAYCRTCVNTFLFSYHFFLYLYNITQIYCYRESLRKWFITQETELFRHRFQRESWPSQQKFLEWNDFKYAAVRFKLIWQEGIHLSTIRNHRNIFRFLNTKRKSIDRNLSILPTAFVRPRASWIIKSLRYTRLYFLRLCC